MKTVSFKVAEAIKVVGYPQGNTDQCYLTADHNQFYKKGQIVDNTDGEWTLLTRDLADIPTYLEIWLWLWREKNIRICLEDAEDPKYPEIERGCYVGTNQLGGICTPEVSDPEDAIVDIIGYLVENKLLK